MRPGGSGVQTYIRELIAALARRDDLALVAAVQQDCVADLPAGVQAVARPRSDGLRRALHAMRAAHDADVVHGLDVDLPWRDGGRPMVATVHDLSVFDVPWAHSRSRATAERALLSRALRAADEIVSVSHFTAERVRARFGRESTVTPLAPAAWTRVPGEAEVAEVRARLRLPDRFVVQVASVEPRKDVDLLVRAGALAGLPVVLAGAGSAAVTGPGQVIGLGYVDQGDLPGIYAAATVVAYLSLYEGFGLPPLEAMACGAAVVASRTGPMPEVLGQGAALVGRDEQEVAGVLRDLASDEGARAALAAAGRRRAEQFSWDTTAALTAGVYASL